MPDVIANNSLSKSIYSFEFVQNLDSLLKRLERNLVTGRSSTFAPLQHHNRSLSKHQSRYPPVWFGRENILNGLKNIRRYEPRLIVENIALLIVNRLVRGENIELFESKFIRSILTKYGHSKQSNDSISIDSKGEFGKISQINCYRSSK